MPLINSQSRDIYIPQEFQIIQAGIEASINNDKIIVASGRYNEGIDFKGKAIYLKSLNGPLETIIDGAGLDDSVVKCISGEGQDTILDGFTITRGNGRLLGDREDSYIRKRGGGMINIFSSPKIINCIFRENLVVQEGGVGGGMYNVDSNPVIINCTFTGSC